MVRHLAWLIVFVPALAFAGEGSNAAAGKAAPPAPPPPAPEVKKTVDAFVGKSVFDATLQAPGMDKPAALKVTFDCKKTAGGRAVDCHGTGKTPMGPWEGQFMIAWDDFSKAVHFIGVTSEGEVHDHVCHWSDDKTLSCDQLKGGGPGGAPATEDFKMTWADGKVMFESVTTLGDGGKISFSGNAKRK